MPGFAPISAVPISALPDVAVAVAAPVAAVPRRIEPSGLVSYQRAEDQWIELLAGIESEEYVGVPLVALTPRPPPPDWGALAQTEDALVLEDFDFVAAELSA